MLPASMVPKGDVTVGVGVGVGTVGPPVSSAFTSWPTSPGPAGDEVDVAGMPGFAA